jgi:indolepyruvate ferredoxin oxidoreductase
VFPGDFTRKPDFALPTERLKRSIDARAAARRASSMRPRAAVAALGNSIGANMFMLGYAYQSGFVPLSSDAIRRAIELNGEAVAMNLAAFEWGRAARANPASLAAFAQAPRRRGADGAWRASSRAASSSSPPIRTAPMPSAIGRW